MYRPTISIRAMLCVVAFIGLACVAMVRANSIWATVMFTAALAVISLAVLAAILRRGAKQAYWIGFAIFGWLYLWMAHWPGEFTSESRLQSDANGTLASTRLLVYVYNEWLPKVRTPPASPIIVAPTGAGGGNPNMIGGSGMVTGFGGGGLGGYGGSAYGGYGGSGTLVIAPSAPPPAATSVVISYPAMHEFTRVGHSLFTITLAFAGGALGAYLYQSARSCRRLNHLGFAAKLARSEFVCYSHIIMVRNAKMVPAGQFKAKCLALLDEVAETGQPVIVTKHGKPVAQVVPIKSKPAASKPLKGSILYQKDLVGPILEPWDMDL